ncbi:MAG: hypothetical protein CSB01_01240 [Bacteroidia bacterium]|nr:MAG: hypothetical protein CSB01_01240 [Bacteroidia bacterium]
MDKNQILKILQDLFGSKNMNFNILEEQVDVKLQIEYFEFSKKIRKHIDVNALKENLDSLFAETTTEEKQKEMLSQLSALDEVWAYRAIEKFLKNNDSPIRYWALLAFHESKMILKGSLLNENQISISTGLGGKGNRLRYFIVLLSKNGIHLNDYQKKIIKNELNYAVEKNNSEIEKLEFDGIYAKILAIIPIAVSLNDMLHNILYECNQFGNFLEKFIISNERIMSSEEITRHLQKRDNESRGKPSKD